MNEDIRHWPHTEQFSVMDIEGDGHLYNRPVEISVLDYDRGQIVGRHYWLINPERPIQPYVRKHIHGITDRMVKSCPTFADIANEFRAAIEGKTLAGHAIKNDMRILASVMSEPHLLPARMVDTATLAKLTLQTNTKVSLEKACIVLGIRVPDEYRSPRPQFHAAEEDAYATGQLLLELPKLLPDNPSIVKQVSHNVMVKTQLNPKRDRNIETETSYGMKP
ncbi:3'-5' exonuclease [Mesorhizobium sp. SP-1A]|uniref:3'-5' exonuclease n=1 Tax=Mesorhizobium sp. SP-1A TaxID=3077840 RepID=UPI0028F735FA|nr:3'-5' exonuclease [Mesorhizobium sp. SP-1A]